MTYKDGKKLILGWEQIWFFVKNATNETKFGNS